MNADSDETLVIVCVLGAVTVTMISNAVDKTKTSSIKPIVGGFALGALLLGVGLWSAPVAKSFSVVLLVTTILVNGDGLFTAINNSMGSTATGGAVPTTPKAPLPGFGNPTLTPWEVTE